MRSKKGKHGQLAVFLSNAKDLASSASNGIGRMVGFRQRYVLTRGGRLRLRFVVTPMIFFCAGLPVITAFTQPSRAVYPADYYAQAGTQERPSKEFSNQLDGTLYGQLSLASAVTAAQLPEPTDKIIKVEEGDALGKVMERAGLSSAEATEIITAMKEHFDPRRLRVGQDVEMHFVPASAHGDMEFDKMQIVIDPIKTLVVTRDDTGFGATVHEKELQHVVRAERAEIEVSLYGSAEKAGIPQSVISNAIRIYSWNVDFQRDIRHGDKLEVMYDSYETEDGYVARTGDVVYAKLTLGGKEIPLYRYEMEDGHVDYFGPDGRSMRRTLMKTPIDGARMSSGFGMRRHPVLGYNKMHKGVDFAASTGTPIYAAGNGTIEKAGRFGGYGNYVRIRHNSSLKTAYAHMSRMVVKPGQRIRQGDLIGYVGTTGRSTGPHLHYEVLVNNSHVNPNSVDLPTGENLAGKALRDFKDKIRDIEQQYAEIAEGIKFAQVQSRPDEHKSPKRYN